jgi:hypothetical protein
MQLISFHPEMAFFRNISVKLRVCLFLPPASGTRNPLIDFTPLRGAQSHPIGRVPGTLILQKIAHF